MLCVEGVDFHYGRVRRRPVFQNFSWTVPVGKRTLLLGPNGAGKSTLLALLAGYQRPTRGRVSFAGSGGTGALFRAVAWMPQHIQPVRGLTVAEQVAYSAWLGGLSATAARSVALTLLERVRLDDKAQEKAGDLSGGQLRRLGLAQALTRQHEVVLLDEPTAGLDPAQARNFREIVRGLDPRAGVVVSTHQVAELEDEFDHIAVVAGGELRYDGSVAGFRRLGASMGVASGDVAEVFSAITEGGLH